ncbi:hypothetical protein D3C87_1686870 [compost metagenome]
MPQQQQILSSCGFSVSEPKDLATRAYQRLGASDGRNRTRRSQVFSLISTVTTHRSLFSQGLADRHSARRLKRPNMDFLWRCSKFESVGGFPSHVPASAGPLCQPNLGKVDRRRCSVPMVDMSAMPSTLSVRKCRWNAATTPSVRSSYSPVISIP